MKPHLETINSAGRFLQTAILGLLISAFSTQPLALLAAPHPPLKLGGYLFARVRGKTAAITDATSTAQFPANRQ
jgi:hypothetical protein